MYSPPDQSLDDMQLISRTAKLLVPSENESSFLIHAPLELLARAALLPHVPEEHRPAARARIAAIGTRYTHEARTVRFSGAREFGDTIHAMSALERGLDGGDGQLVDAAVTWLTQHHEVKTLRRLWWPLVFDRVGLAAHAPILFAELPRLTGRLEGLGHLLRAPLYTLAMEPGRVLTEPAPDADLSPEKLEALLGSPPHVQVASSFIAPRLRGVQELAMSRLGGVQRLPTDVVRRCLLRVAARSMLEDDPESAPYGWTHCFTLPLAVLENADLMQDPGPAHVVAATEVLAFRATSGRVELRGSWSAPPALAERFQPGSASRDESLRGLVVRAALHHDAHLVKYTRACLDAAFDRPDEELLYFAAAERLGQWWDSAGSTIKD